MITEKTPAEKRLEKWAAKAVHGLLEQPDPDFIRVENAHGVGVFFFGRIDKAEQPEEIAPSQTKAMSDRTCIACMRTQNVSYYADRTSRYARTGTLLSVAQPSDGANFGHDVIIHLIVLRVPRRAPKGGAA